VRRLVAYTLPRNRAMLGLARRSGARLEGDASDVELVFDVAALERAYLARRFTTVA
jgi:RimJ/RimL family protein N-acetyltransferase